MLNELTMCQTLREQGHCNGRLTLRYQRLVSFFMNNTLDVDALCNWGAVPKSPVFLCCGWPFKGQPLKTDNLIIHLATGRTGKP